MLAEPKYYFKNDFFKLFLMDISGKMIEFNNIREQTRALEVSKYIEYSYRRLLFQNMFTESTDV